MSTAIDDHRQPAEHGSPGKLKTAFGAAAGTCVENYDFVAYGTASALYFGDVFFPKSDPTVGTLLSFATLGVGFLMRPIGGSIGGYLADRFGRKPVLVGALLLMGIATFAIGLLPTYAQVGVLAPILLVTIRIIQGLAFGAEWGGAVMMAYEHAPWRRRGRFAAIPQAGNPLGIALANIAFLAAAPLDSDWSWRIPFLASAVLIVVGLYVRLRLNESPEFEEAKATGTIVRNPFFTVIREDWRNILRVIALRVVESCAYYLTATYLLSYITKRNAERPHRCADRCRDRQHHRRRHHLRRWQPHRPHRAATRLPGRLHPRDRVRHSDVPADEHRRAVPDRAGVHHRNRHHPRRPDRDAGRLVRGAVRHQDPHLGRLDRLPGRRVDRRLRAVPGRDARETRSAGWVPRCSTSSSGSSASPACSPPRRHGVRGSAPRSTP